MGFIPPTWAGPASSRARSAHATIPVIDVRAMRTGSAAAKARVADRIGRAAREVGFFYIRGHGVDPALIDEVYAQATRFFARPEHEKLACYIGRSANHRGYVPFSERGDYEDEGGRRLYEAFDSALELPPSHPAASLPLMGPNVWPALPGFRRCVTEYYRGVAEVGRLMCRAFELHLGLDSGYFDRFMRAPTSQLRLLHYVENDAPKREDQMNMGAHTDYECFTILHQTAPGLQTLTVDDEWIDAPPIPGTFVVNIGDLMEVWTNGMFRSNPHRVLNSGKERFSMPFFVAADYDAVVEPVASTVTPERPSRYEPLVAGHHLLAQLVRDFPYLRQRPELARAGVGPRDEYFNPFERSKLDPNLPFNRAA